MDTILGKFLGFLFLREVFNVHYQFRHKFPAKVAVLPLEILVDMHDIICIQFIACVQNNLFFIQFEYNKFCVRFSLN